VVQEYQSKAKALRFWSPAKKKDECEHVLEGVIVENIVDRKYSSDPRAKLQIGTVVWFCPEKKCKTHNPERRGTDNPVTKRDPKDVKRERDRRAELERRGRALVALANSSACVTVGEQKELRPIVNWIVNQMGNDQARSLCKAMNWIPKKAKYGNASWRDTILDLVKADADARLWHWLLVAGCAAIDAWYSPGWDGPGKRPTRLLDAALKSREIAIPKAEIEKPVAKKKAVKAKK
jgi:hypothetical protein